MSEVRAPKSPLPRSAAAALIAVSNLGLCLVAAGILRFWDRTAGLYDDVEAAWSSLAVGTLIAGIVVHVFVAGGVGAVLRLLPWTLPVRTATRRPQRETIGFFAGVMLTTLGLVILIQATGGPFESPFGQVLIAVFILGQSFAPSGPEGSNTVWGLGLFVAGLVAVLSAMTWQGLVGDPEDVPIAAYLVVALVTVLAATFIGWAVKWNEGPAPASGAVRQPWGKVAGVSTSVLAICVVILAIVVPDEYRYHEACFDTVRELEGGEDGLRVSGNLDHRESEVLLLRKDLRTGRFFLAAEQISRDEDGFTAIVVSPVDLDRRDQLVLASFNQSPAALQTAENDFEAAGENGLPEIPQEGAVRARVDADHSPTCGSRRSTSSTTHSSGS